MTQEQLLHHIRAEFAGSRIDYEKCAQDMLRTFNKHIAELIDEISQKADELTDAGGDIPSGEFEEYLKKLKSS